MNLHTSIPRTETMRCLLCLSIFLPFLSSFYPFVFVVLFQLSWGRYNVAAVSAIPAALKAFLFVQRTSTLCIHSMYRDQPECHPNGSASNFISNIT